MKFLAVILLLFSFNSNASYCLKAISNGNLRVDTQPVASCPSGMILLSKAEYDLSFQSNVITALDIAGSFTWGFSTYLGFWYMGFTIKTARKTIRLL